VRTLEYYEYEYEYEYEDSVFEYFECGVLRPQFGTGISDTRTWYEYEYEYECSY